MKLKAVSVEHVIRNIRGQKVILDVDLARIYEVSTRVLNQAVKRNAYRFPEDFMFRLTLSEWEGANLSQFVTGSQRHRDPRKLPCAFSEHGAIMVANVLRSRRAVEMSIFVVRAFTRMRSLLIQPQGLVKELVLLEKKLTDRLDVHEVAIVDILRRIMELIDPLSPPPAPPSPPKKPIGFHI